MAIKKIGITKPNIKNEKSETLPSGETENGTSHGLNEIPVVVVKTPTKKKTKKKTTARQPAKKKLTTTAKPTTNKPTGKTKTELTPKPKGKVLQRKQYLMMDNSDVSLYFKDTEYKNLARTKVDFLKVKGFDMAFAYRDPKNVFRVVGNPVYFVVQKTYKAFAKEKVPVCIVEPFKVKGKEEYTHLFTCFLYETDLILRSKMLLDLQLIFSDKEIMQIFKITKENMLEMHRYLYSKIYRNFNDSQSWEYFNLVLENAHEEDIDLFLYTVELENDTPVDLKTDSKESNGIDDIAEAYLNFKRTGKTNLRDNSLEANKLVNSLDNILRQNYD